MNTRVARCPRDHLASEQERLVDTEAEGERVWEWSDFESLVTNSSPLVRKWARDRMEILCRQHWDELVVADSELTAEAQLTLTAELLGMVAVA